MKMKSLEDLYLDELKDLLNAENQILKALPKMAKNATSEELRSAFEDHLEQTKGHVERLQQIFEKRGVAAKGKKCKGMEGIIEEGKQLLEEDMEDEVRDAALIAAAQRVEHYEIAAYGTVRTYARLLGDEEAADLLQETLNEEGETDHKLTELAEGMVNLRAKEPAAAQQDDE
jgi:ferritin-like metal-binding protein YciE